MYKNWPNSPIFLTIPQILNIFLNSTKKKTVFFSGGHKKVQNLNELN